MQQILPILCVSFVGLISSGVFAAEQHVSPRPTEATALSVWIRPYSQKQLNLVLQEIPASAVSQFLHNSTPTDELRNYSITFDAKGKYLSPLPQGPTTCGVGSHGTGSTRYYPVTRPGERNFVAVIKTIDGYRNVLNPIHGFDYGQIPLLTQMTVDQADALWGKAVQEETTSAGWQKKKYKLESTNKKGESKQFFLVCSFGQGKLSGYKISGPGTDDKLKWDVMDDRFSMD